MIYVTIDNASKLQGMFHKYGMDTYTTAAYEAMFNYLNENDTELDVIALCCDFNEINKEDIDELNENIMVWDLGETVLLYQLF
jgi:hypothetical protein